MDQSHKTQAVPVVELKSASLSFDTQILWEDMNLQIRPGEFLAVLGPNGAGKSSLLKVFLGLTPLSHGSVEVNGAPAKRGNPQVGYVPQQKAFSSDVPIRGRDLVQFGIDGNKWGLHTVTSTAKSRVDTVIDAVGASKYADKPIGELSGGEQQRLRIAQALVTKPQVLLCDEPLLSLDLASQHTVSNLINEERKQGTAVVFVTHEINPILSMVDRVLYIVAGKWKIGTPEEVLTSASLSELYGVHVEVIRVHGRVIVVSDSDVHHHHVGEGASL